MTTQEQRGQMATAIVDFEARRDAAGHLMVYHPPSGDGGGAYEVAGINARYNRATAKTLAGLIGQQRFEEAERLATDFIARNTDCAASWTEVPALEFYLRDCVFNRGARGGALILQRALGIDPDGKVGPDTRAAAARADPADVLARLRKAREQYERDVAHRDERSKFWAGLLARWDKAITVAKRFPMTPTPAPATEPAAAAIVVARASAPSAVPRSDDRAADTIKGSHFPPRPDFAPLVTNRQRETLFGHYQYVSAPQPGNPEAIRIAGSWEHDNIVEVLIPQLRKALGDKAPNSIRFHRLAAGQLQSLWAEWERAGLLNRILSFGGGFVARFVRGSRSVLSNHAFGSAFDINEAYNPFGQRPVSNGRKGCVRDLVPIANRCGFYWGGHYQGRTDGMHFEIAVLGRKVTPQPSPERAIASGTADSVPAHEIAASAVQTPPLAVGASPPAAPA
jgi:D-alanyl-D-alanine carboxypeptidase/Predicted Peptidoglycan domain